MISVDVDVRNELEVNKKEKNVFDTNSATGKFFLPLCESKVCSLFINRSSLFPLERSGVKRFKVMVIESININ